MKTFFDKTTQDDLESRLQKLDAQAKGQWGKMNPAQMLAHCGASMEMPLGDLVAKRSPLSVIGWMFRGVIRNDKPFSKNAPTSPEYLVRDEREFDAEKRRFLAAFRKLSAGPASLKCDRHPFFGKLSSEDWGHLIYKHLDHHFRQFGV